MARHFEEGLCHTGGGGWIDPDGATYNGPWKEGVCDAERYTDQFGTDWSGTLKDDNPWYGYGKWVQIQFPQGHLETDQEGAWHFGIYVPKNFTERLP